jgi:hypothetical protein
MSRNALSEKPFDHAAEEKKFESWVAIARRVIRGDYNKSDSSTIMSITIGIRGCKHPDCQRALAVLKVL